MNVARSSVFIVPRCPLKQQRLRAKGCVIKIQHETAHSWFKDDHIFSALDVCSHQEYNTLWGLPRVLSRLCCCYVVEAHVQTSPPSHSIKQSMKAGLGRQASSPAQLGVSLWGVRRSDNQWQMLTFYWDIRLRINIFVSEMCASTSI